MSSAQLRVRRCPSPRTEEPAAPNRRRASRHRSRGSRAPSPSVARPRTGQRRHPPTGAGASLPPAWPRRPRAVGHADGDLRPRAVLGLSHPPGLHAVVVLAGTLTVFDGECRTRTYGPGDSYVGGGDPHLPSTRSAAPVEMAVRTCSPPVSRSTAFHVPAPAPAGCGRRLNATGRRIRQLGGTDASLRCRATWSLTTRRAHEAVRHSRLVRSVTAGGRAAPGHGSSALAAGHVLVLGVTLIAFTDANAIFDAGPSTARSPHEVGSARRAHAR